MQMRMRTLMPMPTLIRTPMPILMLTQMPMLMQMLILMPTLILMPILMLMLTPTQILMRMQKNVPRWLARWRPHPYQMIASNKARTTTKMKLGTACFQALAKNHLVQVCHRVLTKKNMFLIVSIV